MWNPEKIEIYGLYSHVETIYEFNQNKCTVIFGENLTDKGLQNNGSGKSTIFEAVALALTNEVLKKGISKDVFINEDSESCKVVFHSSNKVLNKTLKISRQFFRSNKPVKVQIWEDGELNKQVTSVNEANKRILEILGINRDDLLRYFIISQDNRYTFFTASDSEKKDVLNRITSADMINPIIEELELRSKEKKAILSTLESDLTRITDTMDTLEEQKREVLANDNKDEEIKELEDLIAEEVEAVKRDSKISSELTEKIKEYDSLIKNTETVDCSDLKKRLKKNRKEAEELEDSIASNNKMYKAVKIELEDEISCPNCKHVFILESKFGFSKEEAEAALLTIEKENENIQLYISKKEKNIKIIKKKLAYAEEQNAKFEELEEQRNVYIRRQKRIGLDIADANRRKASREKELTAVKNRKSENNAISVLEAKINELSEKKDEVVKEMTPLVSELENITFWKYNMGKSGFMTYLANKSVKVIEGMTNNFLKKFNVDLSVLINGFSVLRSGEVREKIDIFVTDNGVNAKPFNAKSGGERGRIILAGIICIQNLINMSSDGRGLNMLLLDEVFPGISPKGQERMIKILNKVGITVMLITQNVEVGINLENSINIVKREGVSRIEEK